MEDASCTPLRELDYDYFIWLQLLATGPGSEKDEVQFIHSLYLYFVLHFIWSSQTPGSFSSSSFPFSLFSFLLYPSEITSKGLGVPSVIKYPRMLLAYSKRISLPQRALHQNFHKQEDHLPAQWMDYIFPHQTPHTRVLAPHIILAWLAKASACASTEKGYPCGAPANPSNTKTIKQMVKTNSIILFSTFCNCDSCAGRNSRLGYR